MVLLVLAGTACTTGRNYVSPVGPGYRGTVPGEPPARLPDSLLVVSFNVELSPLDLVVPAYGAVVGHFARNIANKDM